MNGNERPDSKPLRCFPQHQTPPSIDSAPQPEERLIERGKYVIRGRLADGFIEASLHVRNQRGELRPLPSSGVWSFAAKEFDETAMSILETWARYQGVT